MAEKIITHSFYKEIIMLKNISNVLTNEDGATLVEYGLVVALIAAVAVVAVTALGAKVNATFTNITKSL
jgi:pilus assembly protein Flp/PilA